MLAAIVERILPEDFFSPSLLPSRACPLVLLDYVQEFTPKLHAHLTDLGVDLAAICFSWFLSLFTDCLPVEVRFPLIFIVFGFSKLTILFSVFQRRCLECGMSSLSTASMCSSALRLVFSGTMKLSCCGVSRFRLFMSLWKICLRGCGRRISLFRCVFEPYCFLPRSHPFCASA